MKKAKTKKDMVAKSNIKPSQKKQGKQKPVRNVRKKVPEKKGASNPTVLERIDMVKQFLRESKLELKKVKWPTKKELFAATAVVIFLSLLMAVYFGIVDFGLIKIIKLIIR